MRTLFLVCLLSFHLTGCTRPDKETLIWNLPNKDVLIFYHDQTTPWQSDHAKILEITSPSGSKRTFEFGASHSGYQNVDLYINSNNSIIWLVDRRNARIGAALRLDDYEFKEEKEISTHHQDGVELFGAEQYGKRINPIEKIENSN